MKKYLILLVLITCSAVQLHGQPNISREEKLQMIEMLSGLFGKSTPSKTPVPDVIANKGLPVNPSKADFDKKLKLFANSFYFSQSSFRDNEARIEADVFHLPNAELIKGAFVWSKATAGEGGSLEIVPGADSGPVSSLEYLNETVVYKPQSGKSLNTIEGTFSFTYPTEFKQIAFTKAEVGKIKTLEDETIKLLWIENDIAMFQVNRKNPESDLNYFALNADGKLLSLEVLRSEIPKTIYDLLDKNGKIPEDKKKQLLDKFDNLMNDPVICYIKALGTINQLVIMKPKGISNGKIDIVAHRTPDFAHEEFDVPQERYENQSAAVKYQKLSETDLNNLKIKVDRTNDGYNNHLLILAVPNVPNSAFAKVEFKDVVATQAGKQVTFDPQGAFYNDKPKTYSFRLDPPGGDQPIDCDLIKGAVLVSYPVEITTQAFPVKPQADNFEMRNPVTVSYFTTEEDLDMSGELKPKRAYATNGLRLKRVDGIFRSGSSNGRSYTDYIYWGKPATIEIDKAIKWVTKEIPFTVTPVPKKPKPF